MTMTDQQLLLKIPCTTMVEYSSDFHSECPHLSNIVNVTEVIIKIQQGLANECPECSSKATENSNDGSKIDIASLLKLWLCCSCGSKFCGLYNNEHALRHFKTLKHAVCINTMTAEAYCYECNMNIAYKPDSNIGRIAAVLKQQPKETIAIVNDENNIDNRAEQTDTNDAKLSNVLTTSTTNNIITLPTSKVNSRTNGAVPKATDTRVSTAAVRQQIRGLKNLGNTCFFNAVLQCLVQTPYLVEVLKFSAEPGEEFTLQGGSNKDDIFAPPFTGKLKAWYNFTSTLAETLQELRQNGGGGSGSYAPQKLFSTFVDIQPQFAGGDQHDSHELLRHLLDAVRNDDMKRYRKQVLDFLEFHKSSYKQKSESDQNEIQAKCRIYSTQINNRILIPEHVFRGFLVSTLTCQDCYHTSPRHESFLDISLPVNINRLMISMADRSSTSSAAYNRNNKSNICKSSAAALIPSATLEVFNNGSPRMSKKEKKIAKKILRNKKQAKLALAIPPTSNITTTAEDIKSKRRSSSSSSSSSSSESLSAERSITRNTESADIIAGNAAYDTNGNSEIAKLSRFTENGTENDQQKTEYNRSMAKVNNQESEFKSLIVPSSSQNELLQIGISDNGKALLIDQQDDSRRQSGRFSTNATINKTSRVRTKSFTECSTTIAPAYVADENECSIQSCLQNFTEVEYLNGNNKVGCDMCTETFKCKDGKSYYTEQTKQLLLSSPPAVMILHLKRFQLGMRGTFHKLSDRITFPLILDMAPFCSSTAKHVTNVRKNQTKIIYSLYGVVEHSGGMHGGHYIAYVKVRPQISLTDPRWKFIPKNSRANQMDEQKERLDANLAKQRAREKIMEMRLKHPIEDSDDTMSSASSSDEAEDTMDQPTEANLKPLPGKWYYASDSSISEVDEKRVLNAQAYLLFYERIY